MDLAGFGSDALRCIEADRSHRIDVAALRERIASDRRAGLREAVLRFVQTQRQRGFTPAEIAGEFVRLTEAKR